MHAYAIQPSEGLVKLDAMENPFRLPEALQRELGERLGEVAINRYPTRCVADVIAALRVVRRAAARLQADARQRLGRADRAARARLRRPRRGDPRAGARLRHVRDVGAAAGAEVRRRAADARPSSSTSTRCSPRSSEHRPALTYIAYPNNPTANLFDERAVEHIVAAVGAQDGLVVFDEAYQPFSSRSWMPKVGSLSHVLVLRTLSKFGLAGVRLGYLAGPAALIDEIDKVRPPYNIGALNAEATLFALEHADEFARQAALLRGERARLQRELAATAGRDARSRARRT